MKEFSACREIDNLTPEALAHEHRRHFSSFPLSGHSIPMAELVLYMQYKLLSAWTLMSAIISSLADMGWQVHLHGCCQTAQYAACHKWQDSDIDYDVKHLQRLLQNQVAALTPVL